MSLPLGIRVRAAVKRTLARALYGSGILARLTRQRLAGRAVVLTYHRVLDDRDAARTWSHPGIVVRRRTFEQHLAALREHFDVLSLPAFVARVESGQPFERPACLVTFDDGWIDTYAEAFPALRAAGVPATVFLPVDFIGAQRMFWQERASALAAAIAARAHGDATFAARARAELAPFGLDRVLDLPAADARQAIMDTMQALKLADPAAARSPLPALGALAAECPPADGADAFMTWEQAREMAGAGITFGGHGTSHRLLTTLAPDEVEAEIAQSRTALERELPGHTVAFCYPNGNWNPQVADAVRAQGFRLAFSTQRGLVGPDSPRFALQRVNMHEDVTSTVPLFLARLAGVL